MTRRCAESVELSCSWAKNAPSQGMIDRGRRGAGELDPASRVAVPTGRDFTDKQLHARLYGLYALYGLVRAHPLADPMSPEGGAAQRGHGAVRGAEPGSALTHRQVAKALADVAAKVTADRRQGRFTGTRGRQLAGRCGLINTGAFPYGEEWRQLAAAMEATLRLHDHQPGALLAQAQYLHTRPGGMIGSLAHLIRAAAIRAILSRGEALTPPLLDKIRLDHAAESATRRVSSTR